MRVLLCVTCAVVVFVAGCAGREAHPVAIYQPGDDQRGCESLKGELSQCQAEIDRLKPKSDKTARNVICAVTGCFVIFPWFLMDLRNAEKTELAAMVRRHDYLKGLAADKGCLRDSETLASR